MTRPAISTTRAFNPKRLRSGGLIIPLKIVNAEPDSSTTNFNSSTTLFGVSLEPLTLDYRRTLNISYPYAAVVISSINLNSEAAKKGLEAGDVITEVNNRQVSNPDDISKTFNTLRQEGKKSALLKVVTPWGEIRLLELALN